MKFREFGDKNLPTFILLHGGGLSWWSLTDVVDKLKDNYYIVTPILDGHGEDGNTTFLSIEDCADKLIQYININCNGKVFAIAGLSIGAQIVVSVLAKSLEITQYAVIESALVYPMKGMSLTVPTFQLFYGLIKRKWFSKIQAKALFVPEDKFELYYEDSLHISKESLINITISNGTFSLPDSIAKTKSKVLIIVGEKEISIMKKSAELLHKTISESQLFIAEKMGHGEISLKYPEKYISLINIVMSAD